MPTIHHNTGLRKKIAVMWLLEATFWWMCFQKDFDTAGIVSLVGFAHRRFTKPKVPSSPGWLRKLYLPWLLIFVGTLLVLEFVPLLANITNLAILGFWIELVVGWLLIFTSNVIAFVENPDFWIEFGRNEVVAADEFLTALESVAQDSDNESNEASLEK